MFPYQKIIVPTKFMFFHPDGDVGDSFQFSSDLDKIGVEWDVRIANGTYIDVISGPLEIDRPKYGRFTVIKIRADVADDYHTIIKEFWVPLGCIVKVGEDEVTSSELSN